MRQDDPDPGDVTDHDGTEDEAAIEIVDDSEKRWHRPFLDALAKLGNVSDAAREARISRKTAYGDRQSNETFALAWADALEAAADALEAEARLRALQGRVIHEVEYDADGKVVHARTVQRYSDTLLIFLLKGLRPEKFRDNVRVVASGPGGGPIQHEVTARYEEVAAEARAELARLSERS